MVYSSSSFFSTIFTELSSKLTIPEGLENLTKENQLGLVMLKVVEIIGEDDSQQYLLIHSLKSRFGVFLKKDNMILEFSANNIDDMPTLFFQETNFNEGKCFLKYWRISKQQWDHIEVLINKAKELRKSDKGSEKHIYSERILVDILEGYKDTYSTKKIKPTLEVAFKLN